MFIIYGKKKCSFCEKAVKLIRNEGFDFRYFSMDEKLDDLKHLSTIYDWRTVPLILKVEGDIEEFIGGYDDLIKRVQVETSEKDDK
mgnify:CR=1 FL=1